MRLNVPDSFSVRATPTVEVQVRIEEVGLVKPALLPLPLLKPIMATQKPFLTCSRIVRDVQVFSDFLSSLETTFFNRFIIIRGCCKIALDSFLASLRPHAKHIYATQRVTIQVRLVGVYVAIKAGIDSPFDDLKGGIETGRYSVADGMFKVVTEDQRLAVDRTTWYEREAYGVLVMGVRRMREVGRGRW